MFVLRFRGYRCLKHVHGAYRLLQNFVAVDIILRILCHLYVVLVNNLSSNVNISISRPFSKAGISRILPLI